MQSLLTDVGRVGRYYGLLASLLGARTLLSFFCEENVLVVRSEATWSYHPRVSLKAGRGKAVQW